MVVGLAEIKANSAQLELGLGLSLAKTKNDLRVMKRILYDMGPLTLVRWLLQRGLKFEPPFGPRSRLKRVPPTQKSKKISVS